MSKVFLAVAVIGAASLLAATAWAVPPPTVVPQVHSVDVGVDIAFEAITTGPDRGRYLIFTFTTQKKGSSLVGTTVNVSPAAPYTVSDTELVGNDYVTVVRILVEAPNNAFTDFTVDYEIVQTAGKSGVTFVGEAAPTARVDDYR